MGASLQVPTSVKPQTLSREREGSVTWLAGREHTPTHWTGEDEGSILTRPGQKPPTPTATSVGEILQQDQVGHF